LPTAKPGGSGAGRSRHHATAAPAAAISSTPATIHLFDFVFMGIVRSGAATAWIALHAGRKPRE